MKTSIGKTSTWFLSTLKGRVIVSASALLIMAFVALWFMLPKSYVWTNDAYIEAYDVQISSDIEARITKIYFAEGDFVEKGAPMIDLKRDILDAELIEAEKEAVLAEEILKKEQASLAKIRDDFFIAKDEFAKNIISFLDYDHVEKDFIIASQQVKIAEKALEKSIASKDVILARLDHTTIFAPRDGYIAKRWILPGDVATVGAPLFTMNELDFLWVNAKLEETKLQEVKVGDPVTITVDCYPDRVFTGKVWVIKPSAAAKFALIPPSNATGNFTKVVQRIPVKILLEKPKESGLYLFPGMSCEVMIDTTRKHLP